MHKLRDHFAKTATAEQYNATRAAYYKAAEGLSALRRALAFEMVNMPPGEIAVAMQETQQAVIRAHNELHSACLGEIL
jgi:hypothetical protein